MSTLFEQLTRELKLSWRRLRSAPGPAVFAIVTLAIGIGVTVATYSVVYSALWRPLGIPGEDRIALIGRTNTMRPGSRPISWADYQELARQPHGFAAAAGWSSFGSVLAGLGTAELVRGEVVTGNYFDFVGVRAHRGRLLTSDDDRAGARPVAVLSHRAWRNQFGADRDIVGKTVKIADRPFEIVGVAPRGFRGVNADGFTTRAVWVPLVWSPLLGDSVARIFESRAGSLTVGVRLRPDHTWASAAAAVTAAGERLDALTTPAQTGGRPEAFYRRWTAAYVTDDQSANRDDEIGRLIVGLPALVLLIACTNIANLVLSRGAARRHDFGVRRALGASRWRLIREQLVEQALVTSVGGVAGVIVAHYLVRGASAIARENLIPFLRGAQVDWSLDAGVLTSAGVAVLLSIVVAGLIPALHLTRDSMRTVLDQGGGGSTPKWRGRANLIALQLGVSVGLFLVAVIFVRMLLDDSLIRRNIAAITPGSHQVAVATIPFRDQQRDDARTQATVEEILREIRQAPGVVAAAASSDQPFGRFPGVSTFNFFTATLTRPERAPGTGPDLEVLLTTASPGMFAVRSKSVRFGRAFNDGDTRSSADVVIVNEGLALDLFGERDVVGRELVMAVRDRRLSTDAVTRTATVRIVGVLDGAQTTNRPNRHVTELYVPFTQQAVRDAAILVQVAPGRRSTHSVPPSRKWTRSWPRRSWLPPTCSRADRSC